MSSMVAMRRADTSAKLSPVEVEVGGAVVRIGGTAKADLVAAVIQALQVQR